MVRFCCDVITLRNRSVDCYVRNLTTRIKATLQFFRTAVDLAWLGTGQYHRQSAFYLSFEPPESQPFLVRESEGYSIPP